MNHFVSFVLLFLLLSNFTSAQNLIQDCCKKAAAGDPKFDYGFCVQSLEDDPESKTATTIEELFMASTKSATSKSSDMKSMAKNILKDPKHPPAIDDLLRDCVEDFSDAVDATKEALKSAKSHDYGTANVELSAALDAPTTCEDGFKERKQPCPFQEQNVVLYQKILIPLVFSNMI